MTDCIERYIFPQNLSSNPFLRPHFTDGSDEVDNNDYRFESARLQTYKNWPCSWMKPERLATAGFFYTGESDKVKCFECSVEICQWQSDDNPIVDHQRWSGKCRFVRNISCGNVPIGVDPNTIPAPSPKGRDVCGPYGVVYMPLSAPDNDINFEETVNLNLSNIAITRPKYPKYASYDARLSTFENWPTSNKQKKEDLAFAGFYYTGNNDQTLCYHCGGGLQNWVPEDDPWQQHARWFEHCPYLLMVKGRDFVSKTTGKTYKDILEPFAAGISDETLAQVESLASANTSTESTECASSSSSEEGGNTDKSVIKVQSNEPDKDARLCKICYSRELRMLFIPCGHLLTCAECSKNMKICGVCRKPVKITVQAYIP